MLIFEDIYNATIKHYPSEIDISDGKLVEKGSGTFESIIESWDKAELKTENEPNYIKLMVWEIFCAYHTKAIDNFLIGRKIVSVTELDMEYIKSRFESSLLNLNITMK